MYHTLALRSVLFLFFFFFQAEDGIRDLTVTGVQTCALPIYNLDRGAQIIDINMGCPAKKVCNKWAGSALMQNEALAVEIAQAVVEACAPHGVPVKSIGPHALANRLFVAPMAGVTDRPFRQLCK